MTDSPPPAKQRRSLVRDLLDLVTGNHLVTDQDAATVLGTSKQTVRLLRASDSFKSLLALNIEKQHGDAIKAVRNNTLVAANDALEAGRRMINDGAVLPAVRLEAMRVLLENHHKTEDRLIPKGPVMPGQGNSVTINLTTNELHEARTAALAHGASLELEASNDAHAQDIFGQNRRMLASVSPRGDKV